MAARLAETVRQGRLERGWTIEAAAERMEIEPAHVRRIERAEANPSLAVLVSIAHAFGMPVDELLGGRTDPQDVPASESRK